MFSNTDRILEADNLQVSEVNCDELETRSFEAFGVCIKLHYIESPLVTFLVNTKLHNSPHLLIIMKTYKISNYSKSPLPSKSTTGFI